MLRSRERDVPMAEEGSARTRWVAKWCFVSGSRGSWAAACRRRTARGPGGHRDPCGAALDGRGRINSWDVAFRCWLAGPASERGTYVAAGFLGGRMGDQSRRRAVQQQRVGEGVRGKAREAERKLDPGHV
jgi:hypothetical protein